MPAKITIPLLSTPVPRLPAMPQINIADNPYVAVEKAAAQIGKAVQARALLDEETRAAAADANLGGFGDTYTNDRREAGEIGVGFADHTRKAFDERAKNLRASAKTPGEARRIDESAARHRGTALDRAMRAEAFARQYGFVTRTQEALNDLAEIARTDPSAYGHALDEVAALAAELPAAYRPLVDAAKAHIHEAHLRGLIATNPARAHGLLHNGMALGISAELHEALTHEADIAQEAFDADAARKRERIRTIMNTRDRLAQAEENGIFDPGLYAGLIEAHALDPAIGRELEKQTAGTHERIRIAAKRNQFVAEALAGAKTITWDNDHLKSLDAHIAAVAGDAPPAVANKRKIALALRAGHVPPKMREDILASLHANDPARRIESAKMLAELDEHGGALIDWAPAGARDTALKIKSLMHAGYDENTALSRIDAARTALPAQEEARRHHFDTSLDADTLARAIDGALGTNVTGVMNDDEPLQPLAYRPEEGEAQAHAADYRSDRDHVELVPILKRDAKGEVEFLDAGERQTLRDPETGKEYETTHGVIFTNRGNIVYARKNLSPDRRLTSNCHGYTFAGGKYWIDGRYVEPILTDEFDKLGSIDDLKEDDIVVYRDKKGVAVHSARVVEVRRDAQGRVTYVKVIGKRGSIDSDGVTTEIGAQWRGHPRDRHFYRRKKQ